MHHKHAFCSWVCRKLPVHYCDFAVTDEAIFSFCTAGASGPDVTAPLLQEEGDASDVVLETTPETIALDWHNICCTVYKVQ